MGTDHRKEEKNLRNAFDITVTDYSFIQYGDTLKCNDGLGNVHGIPPELEEHQCDPGIQNCVKIFATGTNTTEKNYGWGCGTKQSRDGCVDGLPDGVTFDTGVKYSSIMTCFCHKDLCNTEDWCSDCHSNSSGIVPSLMVTLVMTLVSFLYH